MAVESVPALHGSRTALLTTFRRDGRPVTTPVSIALVDGRVFFVTAVDSGKAKRLAHSERVALAPCTARGKPLGPEVTGRARLVDRAARRGPTRSVLRPTGSLFWSWLLYRIRGHAMAFYEAELDQP
jgi:PPOX class probable F420-dependent enzyme